MRMALNADTEYAMRMNVDAEKVALNADTEKWWLWTPKRNNGSERQTENNGSERQTKLNNHERQAENDDSERRNKEGTEALNAELQGNDGGEICPCGASDVTDLSWWLISNSMGMYRRSDMYPVKWRCENPWARDDSIRKSHWHRKVWTWWNDPRANPLEESWWSETKSSTWHVSRNKGQSCKSENLQI